MPCALGTADLVYRIIFCLQDKDLHKDTKALTKQATGSSVYIDNNKGERNNKPFSR